MFTLHSGRYIIAHATTCQAIIFNTNYKVSVMSKLKGTSWDCRDPLLLDYLRLNKLEIERWWRHTQKIWGCLAHPEKRGWKKPPC